MLDGRELLLTLRRAELLALLALHPAGLTAEQLALQLYGEDGNPTTARAEVHRLRAQLGEEVIRTKPYRLRAEVDADFLAARMALRARDARAALAVARAPLLARSERRPSGPSGISSRQPCGAQSWTGGTPRRSGITASGSLAGTISRFSSGSPATCRARTLAIRSLPPGCPP